MFLDIFRKRKPKDMKTADARKAVMEKLEQCLPDKESAPAWYSHVSGDIYAEDQWESKEVFRSLHRKFCAINPTDNKFWKELHDRIPEPYKRPVEVEDGTDLAFKTNFISYMGRRLQVNGEVFLRLQHEY